jgi:transcriptional regulator with XRE-family HTH domain
MNNLNFLEDLHIGKIIKEIAFQKGISSKKLANVIHRYYKNADKIFKLNDMDIEDIVRISYLLEYNILEDISKKHLSHLPHCTNIYNKETIILKIDMRTQRVSTCENVHNCDFLKNIAIGREIRKIAEQKGWSEKDIAKKLQKSQSTISDLYRSKSIKIKNLIRISDIFKYHFIAEVYLSQMMIVFSTEKFDNCILTINPQQIHIISPNDESFLLVFQRNDDKK